MTWYAYPIIFATYSVSQYKVGVHRLRNFGFARMGRYRVRLLFPRLGLITKAHKGQDRFISTKEQRTFFDNVTLEAVGKCSKHDVQHWPVSYDNAMDKSVKENGEGKTFGFKAIPGRLGHRLLHEMHRIVNDPNHPESEALQGFRNFIMYYEAQDLKLYTSAVFPSLP